MQAAPAPVRWPIWKPVLVWSGAFVAGWAIVLYCFAAQWSYASGASLGDAWLRTLHEKGPWVALSPLIFGISRLAHGSKSWWRAGVIHVMGALACVCLAEILLQGVLHPLIGGPPDSYRPPSPPLPPGMMARPLPGMTPRHLPPPWGPPSYSPSNPPLPSGPGSLFLHAFRKTDLWVPLYLLLASVSHAVLFSRNLRERERRVSDLERRLMESQADLLRLQLEPHFLFNTLNAIGTLVYRDAGLADDLISQLATLLRRLLDLRDVHFIPLRDELDVLRAYLAIERARFGDRLRCEERIEPSALDYPVPVLLLQPLAENAVRHGIEPLGRSGTLVYSAAVEPDGVLVLAIEDDGVGFREDATVPDRSTGGIGIRNVRSRIEVLYGPRASVKMTPRPGGGVRVTIRIPPLSNLSPASSS